MQLDFVLFIYFISIQLLSASICPTAPRNWLKPEKTLSVTKRTFTTFQTSFSGNSYQLLLTSSSKCPIEVKLRLLDPLAGQIGYVVNPLQAPSDIHFGTVSDSRCDPHAIVYGNSFFSKRTQLGIYYYSTTNKSIVVIDYRQNCNDTISLGFDLVNNKVEGTVDLNTFFRETYYSLIPTQNCSINLKLLDYDPHSFYFESPYPSIFPYPYASTIYSGDQYVYSFSTDEIVSFRCYYPSARGFCAHFSFSQSCDMQKNSQNINLNPIEIPLSSNWQSINYNLSKAGVNTFLIWVVSSASLKNLTDLLLNIDQTVYNDGRFQILDPESLQGYTENRIIFSLVVRNRPEMSTIPFRYRGISLKELDLEATTIAKNFSITLDLVSYRLKFTAQKPNCLVHLSMIQSPNFLQYKSPDGYSFSVNFFLEFKVNQMLPNSVVNGVLQYQMYCPNEIVVLSNKDGSWQASFLDNALPVYFISDDEESNACPIEFFSGVYAIDDYNHVTSSDCDGSIRGYASGKFFAQQKSCIKKPILLVSHPGKDTITDIYYRISDCTEQYGYSKIMPDLSLSYPPFVAGSKWKQFHSGKSKKLGEASLDHLKFWHFKAANPTCSVKIKISNKNDLYPTSDSSFAHFCWYASPTEMSTLGVQPELGDEFGDCPSYTLYFFYGIFRQRVFNVESSTWYVTNGNSWGEDDDYVIDFEYRQVCDKMYSSREVNLPVTNTGVWKTHQITPTYKTRLVLQSPNDLIDKYQIELQFIHFQELDLEYYSEANDYYQAPGETYIVASHGARVNGQRVSYGQSFLSQQHVITFDPSVQTDHLFIFKFRLTSKAEEIRLGLPLRATNEKQKLRFNFPRAASHNTWQNEIKREKLYQSKGGSYFAFSVWNYQQRWNIYPIGGAGCSVVAQFTKIDIGLGTVVNERKKMHGMQQRLILLQANQVYRLDDYINTSNMDDDYYVGYVNDGYLRCSSIYDFYFSELVRPINIIGECGFSGPTYYSNLNSNLTLYFRSAFEGRNIGVSYGGGWELEYYQICDGKNHSTDYSEIHVFVDSTNAKLIKDLPQFPVNKGEANRHQEFLDRRWILEIKNNKSCQIQVTYDDDYIDYSTPYSGGSMFAPLQIVHYPIPNPERDNFPDTTEYSDKFLVRITAIEDKLFLAAKHISFLAICDRGFYEPPKLQPAALKNLSIKERRERAELNQDKNQSQKGMKRRKKKASSAKRKVG